MEFICLNLSAVLESRILECIDQEVLDELTDYYCNWNPILSKRVITPYSDAPSDEIVRSISETYPVKIEDSDQEGVEKRTPKLSSKRKLRTRKGSESARNKTQSECNFDSSFEQSTSVSETCEEESDKKEVKTDEKWVKILTEKEKHQKIVQARLKAIATAKEEMETEKINENLTKLISTPKIIPKNESSRMSLSSPCSSPISKAAPSMIFNANAHFNSEIAKSPPAYEIPIQKAHKLSQKQRKKLAAETSTLSLAQQLDRVNKKPSWNSLVSSKDNNSFADIMKSDGRNGKEYPELSNSPRSPWQKVEVPAPVESPENKTNFMDIVADEKKQKENWTKMRARPLIFTQVSK